MPKHLQQIKLATHASAGLLNGAQLYNVDVAHVEVRGGTCVRRDTLFSLRRTRNNKVATGLPVEQQSHRVRLYR